MCVGAAGSDAVLARYRKELGSAITRELEGDSESKMWRAIENFPGSNGGQHDGAGEDSQLVDLTVWPREVVAIVDTLLDAPAIGGPDVSLVGRVGVGHLRVLAQGRKAHAGAASAAVAEAVRGKLDDRVAVKIEGAANPWPAAPANLSQMRAVKQALDPNHVLRGRDIF